MSSDDSAAPDQPSLEQAWDGAAAGYHEYFMPRFAPWSEAAVAALPHPIPHGNIVVPCAGTGPEVKRLLGRHPQHGIVAVDLSAGMLQLARDTCPSDRVTWLHSDAADTAQWPAPVTGLVTVFGLQQMPDPLGATANWMARLEPGATAVLCFWPAVVEDDGPFNWVRELIAPLQGQIDTQWEAALAPHLEACGADVVLDAPLSFNMLHPSAETLWDAMLNSGPLARLRMGPRGAELLALKRAFLARAPRGTLSHQPRARCIVARRSP